MMYIPKQWYKNPENESKVLKLVLKETDVLHPSDKDDVYSKLVDIGEDFIADKYKSGEIGGEI